MIDTSRYIPTNIVKISTTSLDDDTKAIRHHCEHDNLVIDLSDINIILPVLWFRKLRASLTLHNKVLIGACNPGICLENLKSASIPIIESHIMQLPPNETHIAVAETHHNPSENISDSEYKTIVHHGHLRGGQSIRNPYADIIIIGNLHYGAEVMAGGNIHILGSLNGRALAGTHIGNKAIISAYALQAELISIDGYYLSSDEIKPQNHPSTILLLNEEICIRSFDNF